MCGLKSYYKTQENLSDSVKSGGEKKVTYELTTYALDLICARIKFIDNQFKVSESNYG